MAEVAALGLRVEGAEGVDRAASSLDRLSEASDSAEKSSSRLRKVLALAGRDSSSAGARMAKAGREASTAAGGVDRLKKSMDGVQSSANSLKRVLTGAFIGVSIAGTIGKIISETRKAEQEQAQLAAALKSTGNAAGFSRDELNQMAAAMSAASTLSAGEINQAQTSLLAFTGVAGDQFKDALQSAIDMSARTGMSVTSAMETIGRALDVPSQGLTALSRQGFKFSKEQHALAEELEATGRKAEAQGIVLSALEESYGGAAAAARDTFGGAVQGLQNALSDLMTGEDGSLEGAKNSINQLSETLASEETRRAFGTFVSLVTGATTSFANFMAVLSEGSFLGWLLTSGSEARNAEEGVDELEASLAKMRGTLKTFTDIGADNAFMRWYNADDVAILNTQISATESKLKTLRVIAEQNRRAAEWDYAHKNFVGPMPPPTTLPAITTTGVSPSPKGGGKSSELENLVKQLQLQQATLGMTTEQAERYRIETLAGSGADRQRALALFDQIQAWNETEKSMQAAIDSSRQYMAFQQELQVFQERMDLEASAVGMSDRQRELAEQALSIRQEYAQKRLDLEMAQQVKETALSQEQYQERLLMLQQFEESKLVVTQQAAEARALAESDWTNGARRALQAYADDAANIAAQTETVFSNAFHRMEDALVNFAMTGKLDLGAMIRGLGEDLVRMMVKVGLQMAANALMGKLFSGTALATAKIAGAGIATAYAPAAAFASLASFGENSIPASIGIASTVGLAESLALAGMAHDGIDSVPATGTWLLEKGERVTTAKTSARLDSVLERIEARQRGGSRAEEAGGAQRAGLTVNLIENPDRAGQVEMREGQSGDQEADIFVADIFGGGKRARALEAAYGLGRQGR